MKGQCHIYVVKLQKFSFLLNLLTGLDDDVDGDREFLWTERRIRLANRRYGGVDPQLVARTLPRAHRFQQIDSPDAGDSGPLTYPFNSTYPR